MEYKKPQKCRLTKLIDGDTFDCEDLSNGKTFRVRMNSIDAPELSQPAGWEAKAVLYDMFEKNNFEFYVVLKGVGFNGRFIGDVYPSKGLAETNSEKYSFNYELCEKGYAWFYKMNKEVFSSYLNAEQTARSSKIGLWNRNKSDPIHPAQWRKEKRKMSYYVSLSEENRKRKYGHDHNKRLDYNSITLPYEIQDDKKIENEKILDKRLVENNIEIKKYDSYQINANHINKIKESQRKERIKNFLNGVSLNKDQIESNISKINVSLNSNLKNALKKNRDKHVKVDDQLKNEAIIERIKLALEEKNKYLSRIKTDKDIKNEEIIKENYFNLEKIKKNNNQDVDFQKDEIVSNSLDDIFNVDGIDFDVFDDNQNKNQNPVIKETNLSYDISEMDYETNDVGFDNKVKKKNIELVDDDSFDLKKEIGLDDFDLDEELNLDNQLKSDYLPPIQQYSDDINSNYEHYENNIEDRYPDDMYYDEMEFDESLSPSHIDDIDLNDFEMGSSPKDRNTNRKKL